MYRYIGNKSKLSPMILDAIRNEIGDTGQVADLMAGTGAVASGLRKRGYEVIASDVMTYSKHHLTTQLLMDKPPSFLQLKKTSRITGYLDAIAFLNSLEPKLGYFTREFSPAGTPDNGCGPRKYFTAANASKIDAVRDQIEAWVTSGAVNQLEESLLKHDLIMAANEVANISGTYGYFLSAFSKSSLSEFQLRPSTFSSGRIDNTVLQGYAEDLSSQISPDLCYIDPPYIKRQYAANYHILETLARGDEPVAAGKSGLRPWRDQYSDLCTKTKSLQSFRTILSEMNCPKFLISYSEDGLFPVSVLAEVFSDYGDVQIERLEYRRFRSNSSRLTSLFDEYLIHVNR